MDCCEARELILKQGYMSALYWNLVDARRTVVMKGFFELAMETAAAPVAISIVDVLGDSEASPNGPVGLFRTAIAKEEANRQRPENLYIIEAEHTIQQGVRELGIMVMNHSHHWGNDYCVPCGNLQFFLGAGWIDSWSGPYGAQINRPENLDTLTCLQFMDGVDPLIQALFTEPLPYNDPYFELFRNHHQHCYSCYRVMMQKMVEANNRMR